MAIQIEKFCKKVFILELLFIKLGATSKKTPNR